MLSTNDYDPTEDLDDGYVAEELGCTACGGTGVALEGWDCEECDGFGYWEI